MKKYVFITFAVPGIGGTQIYVRNKLLYLQRHGWDVTVISTEPGTNIVIKELKPFSQYIMPELMDNPTLFSRMKRNKILQKMKDYIGTYDEETIIETNFIQVTLWGELLAKELHVRHFIFLIQEEYKNHKQEYLKYYSYKFDRGEFAVNTKSALGQLFEGFRDITDHEHEFLSAECSNVVEECESEFDNSLSDADYHIGSIGRVNKPFVIDMVKDVAEYAKRYPNNTFQLVLFGGSSYEEDYQKINSVADPIDNFSIFITGPIFPIPKHLLDRMDVFISSAGAASTSHNAGYITIAIDANDFNPIGILGHTTMETIHREDGQEIVNTSDLLDEILMEKRYDKRHSSKTLTESDMDKIFDKHMDHLSNVGPKLEYYDVYRIAPKKVVQYGCRVFGKKNIMAIYCLIQRIKVQILG